MGGRVAQGFGRLDVTRLACRCRDLANAAHVFAAVMRDPSDDGAWPDAVEPFPGGGKTLPGTLIWSFEVAVADNATFLVGDSGMALATGFDRAPRGGAAAPELPGPSLRGILRSQAERILRTLKPEAACDPTNPRTCCAARERQAGKEGKPFTRCNACRAFGNEEWAGWVRVRVDSLAGGSPVPFDHVAIDRFTGGARDSLKFDTLAGGAGRWSICLDMTDVPTSDRDWVMGLLALTLGDLHDGRVRGGHGAARGHGRLVVARPPAFAELEPCVRALWSQVGVPFPTQGVAS